MIMNNVHKQVNWTSWQRLIYELL